MPVSIYLSASIYVCLSVCPCVCLSIYQSVHLSYLDPTWPDVSLCVSKHWPKSPYLGWQLLTILAGHATDAMRKPSTLFFKLMDIKWRRIVQCLTRLANVWQHAPRWQKPVSTNTQIYTRISLNTIDTATTIAASRPQTAEMLCVSQTQIENRVYNCNCVKDTCSIRSW